MDFTEPLQTSTVPAAQLLIAAAGTLAGR